MDRLFRDICSEYRDKVYKYLFYSIGNKEDAEDITQEVFLHVYKNIEMVSSHENLGGYVFQVAKFKKLNYARKMMTKKKREVVEFDDNRSHAPDVFAQIEMDRDRAIDESKYVDRVIEKLDKDSKEFYRLYYIKGLSYKEVSRYLGVSETSLRMKNLRLKRRLKGITANISKENFVTNI